MKIRNLIFPISGVNMSLNWFWKIYNTRPINIPKAVVIVALITGSSGYTYISIKPHVAFQFIILKGPTNKIERKMSPSSKNVSPIAESKFLYNTDGTIRILIKDFSNYIQYYSSNRDYSSFYSINQSKSDGVNLEAACSKFFFRPTILSNKMVDKYHVTVRRQSWNLFTNIKNNIINKFNINTQLYFVHYCLQMNLNKKITRTIITWRESPNEGNRFNNAGHWIFWELFIVRFIDNIVNHQRVLTS